MSAAGPMPIPGAAAASLLLARAATQQADLAGIAFDSPWSARLFAITLACAEAGVFSLSEFQAAMIAAVGRHEESNRIEDEQTYYERWIEALVGLLHGKGVVDEPRLRLVEEDLRAALAAMHRHGSEAAPHPLRIERS